MRFIKIISIFIFLSVIYSTSITYAFNKDDSYDEILLSYKDDASYVRELRDYLINKNFNKEDYDKTISLVNKFSNSKVEKYWLIETGRLFFEDIIFQDDDINSIYQKNLIKNNNNENKAAIDTKKELVSRIDDLYYIYEETFNIIEIDESAPPVVDGEGFIFDDEFIKQNNERKLGIIRNAFKKHFKRLPSKNEEVWLSDIDTMKYALYSGYLNKSLTKDDIELIDNGRGHEFFNIDEDDFIEFWLGIYMHQNIEELEIEYIKTRYRLKGIRAEILKKHNIDIYTELSDDERNLIFLVASQNIEFNENRALDYTLELLRDKNLIKLPSSNNPSKPPGNNNGSHDSSQGNSSIEQDFTNDNFFDDLLEVKDNLKDNRFYKIITQAVNILYSVRKEDKTGNYIFFKVNGTEFETGIFLNQNKDIDKAMLKNLFYLIEDRVNIKAVLSKNKVLIQGNQNIAIEDIIDIFENQKGKFENIKRLFNKLNIEIYTKYVLQNNNVSN